MFNSDNISQFLILEGRVSLGDLLLQQSRDQVSRMLYEQVPDGNQLRQAVV